jgi:hypothetical protein
MAPRLRALARKLPSRRVPAHRTYAPELLANGRRRYEETDDSVASIAADFGIHHFSLIRLAKREGWVRFARPPRALPQAAQLLQQAEMLAAQAAGQAAQPDPSAASGESGGTEANAPAPPDLSPVDRLERAVLAELATVEAMREQLGRVPAKPSDAARTAQTLAALTSTLQTIQRLRCGMPAPGNDYDDDMPADIDAFRRELARRIEAFVASQPDDENADGDRDRRPAMVDAV